ncbi:hypothetical protein Ahy_B09g096025 isoform B [Arachis hypogaea]|uniref:Uncharacterized protein n=1 Tax=Arachis hypogaea TaxID=3818 RepID=A0A444XHN6_ARAHY|nr:hypothetical protein Ahy_B09g096025 isoform B [Arachis hypogaea]
MSILWEVLQFPLS